MVGLELILGQSDPSSSELHHVIARQNFADLGSALLTMLQLFTFDSVGSVYRPLILRWPWLAVYFLSYIFVVSITMMNLMTAIMVEAFMDKASRDRAMLRHKRNEFMK